MAKNFKYEHTKWRCVDSHWICVDREFCALDGSIIKEPCKCCLAEYLWLLGFEIPETISYCIAQNTDIKITFRVLGGAIFVKAVPNTWI